MPNYNLVIDSTFKPYSFDELVKPYQIYGEAYRNVEDKYAELEELSSVWDMRLDNIGDEALKEQFNAFKQDLETQAAALASEGLTQGTRNALSKLRGKYIGTFAPMEEAYNINKEIAKEQRQAKLQDPSLMFEWNAADRSISDAIKNPNASYRVVNGNLVTQNVARSVGALAQALYTNDIDTIESLLQENSNINAEDFYKYTETKGFSSADIQDAFNYYLTGRQGEINPALKSIIDRAVNTAVPEDWNANTKNEAKIHALNYALEGLSAGYGQTQTNIMQNPRAMAEMQHNYNIDEIEKRAEAAAGYGRGKDILQQDLDGTRFYYNNVTKFWYRYDKNGNPIAATPEEAAKLPNIHGTAPKNKENDVFLNSASKETVKTVVNANILKGGYNIGGAIYYDKNDKWYKPKDWFVSGKWKDSNLSEMPGNDLIPMEDSQLSEIEGYNEWITNSVIDENTQWGKLLSSLPENLDIDNNENLDLRVAKTIDDNGNTTGYMLYYKR